MTDLTTPVSEPAGHSAALEAAQVSVWYWDAASRKILIRAQGEPVIPDIEGEWQLSAFQSLLQGLSASAFRNAIASDDGKISQRLSLADGRSFRMVGARSADGDARGLLFSIDAVEEAKITPDLEAVFQPIVRLSDGKTVGFEALARWRDGEGCLQSVSALPGDGRLLIGPAFALQMLEEAACALEFWEAEFPEDGFYVQVNLTADDLFRPEVIQNVEKLMVSGRFNPESLRIELTEQMALRDFEAGVAAVTALEASGVSLILDDFGSGHSSLAWLASIPAKAIKLDPELTQLAGTPRADAVLSGIVSMVHAIGMTITAEGIESLDQIAFLKSIGCEYAQGFAFARPMPRDEATAHLRAGKAG